LQEGMRVLSVQKRREATGMFGAFGEIEQF
jgi:hypothetical protein